jgi:hypothetical protein
VTAKRKTPAKRKTTGGRAKVGGLQARELDALRVELERAADRASPPRFSPDPDEVQQSVARLVLTLVEFVRKLLERQAIRRMDEGTLDEKEVEAVGLALMRLEKTIAEIAKKFDLDPDDLNLDLGPLGKLL